MSLQTDKKYLVFYGFAKLTKKAVKRRSVIIQYANTSNYNDRQKKYIEQKMHIVHQRYQTKAEIEDASFSDRSWTKYEYFTDDKKKWKCNIDLILKHNFDVESNHVSLKERTIIRDKLRKEYFKFYNLEEQLTGQQVLIF